MRARSPLTLLAAALLAGSLSASSAVGKAAHRSRCLPRGAQTVAIDRSVRIYSIAPGIEGEPAARAGSYACLFNNGRALTLVRRKPSRHARPLAHLGQVRLAGTIVAYTETQVGIDSGCTGVAVLDVASNRKLITLPAVACFVDAGFVRAGSVTDLAVGSHGAVAWIASAGRLGAESYEVHRATPSGSPELLAEGRGIVPGSLHLAPGGRVSWQDGAQIHSAPLG